jgi:hypothetical protein
MEWRPAPPPHDARHNGTIPVFWRCVRCGTERDDYLASSTLELVSRRYHYPAGYKTEGERTTRATYRAAYLAAVGAINKRQAAAGRRYRKELWQAQGEDV